MDIEKAYDVVKKNQLWKIVKAEWENTNETSMGNTDCVPFWKLCKEHLGFKRNEIIESIKQTIQEKQYICQKPGPHIHCYHYNAILQKQNCRDCQIYLDYLKESVDKICEIKNAIKCFEEAIHNDYP